MQRMKLLLTSNGLSNPSIAKALFELVGKPASETKIVFIPTAANVEEGDKDWLMTDIENIKKQSLASFEIIDIENKNVAEFRQQFEAADVLFFSGGNSVHLMRWIVQSGLQAELPKLLETRVWAGISAGSMVTAPNLALSNNDKKIYYEEEFGYTSNDALHFVDFYIRPHFNSSHFPHANNQYIAEIAKQIPEKIYALDDMSQ